MWRQQCRQRSILLIGISLKVLISPRLCDRRRVKPLIRLSKTKLICCRLHAWCTVLGLIWKSSLLGSTLCLLYKWFQFNFIIWIINAIWNAIRLIIHRIKTFWSPLAVTDGRSAETAPKRLGLGYSNEFSTELWPTENHLIEFWTPTSCHNLIRVGLRSVGRQADEWGVAGRLNFRHFQVLPHSLGGIAIIKISITLGPRPRGDCEGKGRQPSSAVRRHSDYYRLITRSKALSGTHGQLQLD